MDYERSFSETVTSPIAYDSLVAWCRDPKSRLCWPGASDVRATGSVFYFTLNMQAPGAPPAQGVLEEYMGALQPLDPGGSSFSSMLTLTWPSGELGSGIQTWRFEGDGSQSTFTFSMEYVLPRKIGSGRGFNRERFLGAIDRALSLYVSRLAHGPRTAEIQVEPSSVS